MTTRKTRTELALDWAVWHFAELAAVAAPLVLAVLFTAWLALGSALVAAAWAAHEVHTRRIRRQEIEQARTAPRRITGTAGMSAPALPASRETREGA